MNIQQIINSNLPQAEIDAAMAKHLQELCPPEQREKNRLEWQEHFRTHGQSPISGIYYHETLRSKVDQILQNGLDPKMGGSHTCYPDTENRIFISDTLADASNWAQTFSKKYNVSITDYCVLELDLRNAGYCEYVDIRNQSSSRSGRIIEEKVERVRIIQVLEVVPQ